MNASPTTFLSVGVNPGCPPDFTAYVKLRGMFTTAYQAVSAAGDIATEWLGTTNNVSPPGISNGNPYESIATAPPFFVLPTALRLNVDAFLAATQLQIDGNDDFVPTTFTNSIVTQSTAGPIFDPRIHPEHLALLCLNTFEPLRLSLRDYVLAQQ